MESHSEKGGFFVTGLFDSLLQASACSLTSPSSSREDSLAHFMIYYKRLIRLKFFCHNNADSIISL